jgi:hypothetical protein
MKQCFICKAKKPLEDFYVHSRMADGHLGKCKQCCRDYAKTARRTPSQGERIRLRDKLRYQDPKRHKEALANNKRMRLRNPIKTKAWNAVSNAVRDGRLLRQPCEICGAKAEAHHEDYTKPLEVRWMCFKCHRERMHGQITSFLA